MSFEFVEEKIEACCDAYFTAIEAFEAGDFTRAMSGFRDAYESTESSHEYRNKYLSCYGLSRLMSGDLTAVELCRQAAGKEQQDGDVFLNLARAELELQNRMNAVMALKQGLRVANQHFGLRALRLQLGVRRRSALPFLPRTHPVNQTLGQMMRVTLN